jgi:hypothetical protein
MTIMPTLTFTCDLDERAEWEIEQKGWFEQALVHLPDGTSVQLHFWDPIRLGQDLETDLRSGKTCLAEPAMVVIPRVTVANMRAAVEKLYQNGYFDRLRAVFE